MKYATQLEIAEIVKKAHISDKYKYWDLLDELSDLVDEKDDLYKVLSVLFDAAE